MGYGKNLKKHLKERNISTNSLSTLTNIPVSTLYAYMGRDTSVRYDYALMISRAVGIPVEEICGKVPFADEYWGLAETTEETNSNSKGSFHLCFIKKHILPELLVLAEKSDENLPQVKKLLMAFDELGVEKKKELLSFARFLQEEDKKHTNN